MKQFIALLFITCLTLSAWAGNVKTTELKGQVVDNQGQPIAGAKVGIPALNSFVYTDFDGEFILDNVPQTENTIQISMISYEEIKSDIDLSQWGKEVVSIQLRSK